MAGPEEVFNANNKLVKEICEELYGMSKQLFIYIENKDPTDVRREILNEIEKRSDVKFNLDYYLYILSHGKDAIIRFNNREY